MDMATQWQEQHQTTQQDHPDTKSERPSVCSDRAGPREYIPAIFQI